MGSGFIAAQALDIQFDLGLTVSAVPRQRRRAGRLVDPQQRSVDAPVGVAPVTPGALWADQEPALSDCDYLTTFMPCVQGFFTPLY